MRNGNLSKGRNGNGEFSNRRGGPGVRAVQSASEEILPHNHHKQWNVDDWISKIARAWKGGPENTLELARVLHRIRRALERGQWARLWRDKRLPFSKRKAEMLVVIGEELNANKCAHFPSSWRTLYCIARLGPALAERLIVQGRIHPRLRLREARELLADFRPELAPGTPTLSTLNRRLLRFSKFVLTHASGWSSGDCRLVRAELKRLLTAVPSRSNNSLNNPTCREHKFKSEQL